MTWTRRSLPGLAAAALLGALATSPALAQGYPTKPISFIIGFAPGGPSDVLSRIVTDKMAQLLGQPFVIENRAGAAGNIAAQAVARATPDGHTLLLATNGILAGNQFIYKNIGYDPEKDFEYVGIIGQQPNVLFVHPSFEPKTLKDFIAFAKANPDKVNFGSGGVGTSGHLAGELLKSVGGFNMTHVPHRGTGPTIQAVVGNHIQAGFNPPAPLVGLIQSNQIRAIAVTTLQRSPALPDVPTVAESGFPGFEAISWHSIVAPAGTPKDVVNKLNKALVDALKDTETRKKLVDVGIDPVGNSPDEFRAYVKADIPKWEKIIQTAGIKAPDTK
jgi:tripartite-type tricarboxylate transporter receptor subunit TctC